MVSLPIFILIIYIITLSTSSLIKLTVPDPSATLYPLIFPYENQLTLLTTQGVYNITIDSSGNYILTSASNIFDSQYHLDIAMSNVHIIKTSDSSYIYFFPNIKGKVLIKHSSTETKVIDSYVMNHRISSDIYENKYGIISYVSSSNNDKWTGTICLYDLYNASEYVCKNLENVGIEQHGFYCKYVKTFSRIECFYAIDNIYLSQLVINGDSQYFGNARMVLSYSNIIKGIKFDYIENKLYAVSWGGPQETLTSMLITLTAGEPTSGYSMYSNLYCIDFDSIEILTIPTLKSIIVCCSNGNETLCDIFDEYLTPSDVSAFRNTHLSQFRMSLSFDTAFPSLLFVGADPTDTSIVYYIDTPIYACTNIEFIVGKDDLIIIDVKNIVNPIPKNWNNESGMYFYRAYDIHGLLQEVDEDGQVIGDVSFSNTTHLFQRITYNPIDAGRTILSYRVFTKIFGEFYFPSSVCNIVFDGECYESCKNCTLKGTDEDHLCDVCKMGYYFMEGTNNCYNNVPPKYYFDSHLKLFKKCGLNCEICKDENNCLLCSESYTFLYELTNNMNDKECVPECNVQKYKWYNSNESSITKFICLDKENEFCPIEYSCVNNKTNECMEESNDTVSCKFGVPETKDSVLIFDYLKFHILSYYNESFIDIQNNQTITVYDTTQTANEKYKLNNITSIDLGECENKLKQAYNISQNEKLIIAQIDKIEHNYPLNSLNFLIFSQNGTLLNFSICDNTELNITFHSTQKPSTYINDQQLTLYHNESINVFDYKDDFFNDRCTPYSTKHNGNVMDVPLEIRRNEFYANVSFCDEKLCKLGYTDNVNSKVLCLCKIENVNETNEILSYTNKDNKDKPIWKKITYVNIDILYCVKLIFKGEIIKKNIGFIIMTILFGLQLINYIVYFCIKEEVFGKYITNDGQFQMEMKSNPPIKKNKEYNEVNDENNNEDDEKENIEDENKDKEDNEKEIEDNDNVDDNDGEENGEHKENNDNIYNEDNNTHNEKEEHDNNNDDNNKEHESNNNNTQNDYQEKSNEIANSINMDLNTNNQGKNIKSYNNNLLSLNEKSELNKTENINNNNNTINNINTSINNLSFQLQPINYLDYLPLNQAVSLDKRSFLSLYIIRLKNSHPIYLMIKEKKKYYFRNIPISLFIFQLCSNCCLNALFYSDHYVVRNYNIGYNVFYEIPKSLFTMIISLLLNVICGIFGKRELKVPKIIKNEENAKYNKRFLKKMKIIRIYHTIFYIIVFVLSLFDWLYVSIFCAVYQHSQINWLIGVIISIALGLIIPFVLCLISVLFRQRGIEIRNETMFHFSKVVEAMH